MSQHQYTVDNQLNQNHAQFVEHIKLSKMREYRKKLTIFELTGLVQSEKQALKTVCYEKVPFPNMARTNGMDGKPYPVSLFWDGPIARLASVRVTLENADTPVEALQQRRQWIKDACEREHR